MRDNPAPLDPAEPTARRRHPWRVAAAATTAALTTLAVSACSGAAAGDADAGSPTSGATTTVTVGVVPSLALGVLALGEEQGYFEDAGVTLDVVNVDGGPNVVTGVVAGQYDAGFTAYAPPLLAVAGGAPLVAITGFDTVGPDGTNGGVLVRQDSGITRYADLSGKKIATNAARSLLSLTIAAAITEDGGDASGIELVPLPFSQIADAVAAGDVDAGVILDPFLTQAVQPGTGLVDLGDSIFDTLPEGSPSSLLFTSASTADAEPDVIEGLKTAVEQSIAYANDHLDEVKAAGAPLAGLTSDQAAAIELGEFSSEVSADALQPLLDLLVEYGWTPSQPDLSTFLG